MDDEENNNDEELAPMVDGLSGALCILILVSTVFMASSSDLLFESDGGALKIRDSRLDFNRNIIYYSSIVSLSSVDLYQLRKYFIDSGKDGIVFHGAMSNSVENFKEKNTYNLLKIYADLKLPQDIKVRFDEGDASQCNSYRSCIYWGFE